MAGYSGSFTSKSFFSNVNDRIFPLLADINKLQEFVDEYLNVENYQHGFHFQVSMPVVYMSLLDYGEMSSRTFGHAHASQKELFFLIVLDWYEECKHGDKIFAGKRYKAHKHSKAIVQPFIFVDNPISVMLGREMFGWPKSLIAIQPMRDAWLPGPDTNDPSVKIGAMRLSQTFHGESPEFKIVLEIHNRAGMSFGTNNLPFDYLNKAAKWWGNWATNYDAILGQWRHLLSYNVTPSSIAQQMTDMYRSLLSGGAAGGNPLDGIFQAFSNSIELKQLRRADAPQETCYMAIAKSVSEVTAVNGMGMLGSVESMMTSMDGGFSVHVHRFPAYPVVEKLGLAVSHTLTPDGGVPVDVLKPCLPFWINMDFNFTGSEPLSTLVHDVKIEDLLKGGVTEGDLPPFRLEREFGNIFGVTKDDTGEKNV
ncbi:MAG: hypothetical protein HOI25_13030 [Proteobacteria bacterium]|jgi:hypothetical protein|nr:hypothetical protein [Pseudomonadota bacterium]MDG1231418.1 hypothetical protein [Pseudomonadales bacterium]